MQRVLSLATAGLVAYAAPAVAADCRVETAAQIQVALSKAPLEAGLADGLKTLLAKPKFFEDPHLGASCSARPRLDHPLYPGIPVTECTYQRLGLTGWIMVADPSADVAAKWVANACADAPDPKACAARLAAQAWCASQFTFPVAGNLIQPDPRNPQQGVNAAFLHGLVIARPSWLPEKTPVSAETQKQKFAPLLAGETVYAGPVAATSWPSGLTAPVYAQQAKTLQPSAKAALTACPTIARREGWLAISRTAYNQAWRNGRNPLFDIAAKALADNTVDGAATCS